MTEITVEELRIKLGQWTPDTEWEEFIGHRLTIEEEMALRRQLKALLDMARA